jgi:hypothetical protein
VNYCTLFNSAYLSRGLALYESLVKTCRQFHLVIFAFDEATYQILTLLHLPHVTVVSLAEFETAELLAVKPTRTMGEYCWTCTSATILHCLEKLQLSEVCYLDADLYFWQDPQLLIDEMQDASILISEHRYSPQYDNTALSGKYCVQFMCFRADERGLTALKWWKDACVEWCFDRVEPGRFGDQKYLDDWTTRFAGVHVLQNLGGGVAPWNVQQYEMYNEQNLQLQHKTTQQLFALNFYHFHALKFINQRIDFGSYQLSKSIIRSIYLPYVQALLKVEQDLKAQPHLHPWLSQINLHAKTERPITLFEQLRIMKKRIKGVYNGMTVSEVSANG